MSARPRQSAVFLDCILNDQTEFCTMPSRLEINAPRQGAKTRPQGRHENVRERHRGHRDRVGIAGARGSRAGHYRGVQRAFARLDLAVGHQGEEIRHSERRRYQLRRTSRRTPTPLEFNTGEFALGGSAAVLIVGLGTIRAASRRAICSICSIIGARWLRSRPEIKKLADLKGKQLAAAKGTTNYTMFAWFAKQQGVDAELVQGAQYGDAGSCRLRARRSRRRGAAVGAGLCLGQG